MKATYNKIKMKKLIQSDRYLKMMLNDMMGNNGNEDSVLKALFNANISDYKEAYDKIK